jgi:hypothetical protein
MDWKNRDYTDFPTVSYDAADAAGNKGQMAQEEAQQVFDKWKSQEGMAPKVSMWKGFFSEEAALGRGKQLDNLTEGMPAFLQGTVKGFMQGASGGAFKYDQSMNNKGGSETAGNVVGNIGGSILAVLGIGKVFGLTSKAIQAQQLSTKAKLIGSGYVTAKAAGTTYKASQTVRSGADAARKLVRLKTTAVTPQMLAHSKAAADAFVKYTPAVSLYGQIYETFEDDPERGLRLMEDILYGGITGFAAPTIAGAARATGYTMMASLAADSYSDKREVSWESALINGLTIGGLHMVAAPGIKSDAESILRKATPESAATFLAEYSPTARAKSRNEEGEFVFTPEEIATISREAKANIDKQVGGDATGNMPPRIGIENYAKLEERIGVSISQLAYGAADDIERVAMDAKIIQQALDVINNPESARGFFGSARPRNIEQILATIPENSRMNSIKAPAGRSPKEASDSRMRTTGLTEETSEEYEKVVEFVKAQIKEADYIKANPDVIGVSPTMVMVRRPELEVPMRNLSENPDISLSYAEPGRNVQVFGRILKKDGNDEWVSLGWAPDEQRIQGRAGSINSQIPEKYWYNPKTNKDWLDRRMEENGDDVMFATLLKTDFKLDKNGDVQYVDRKGNFVKADHPEAQALPYVELDINKNHFARASQLTQEFRELTPTVDSAGEQEIVRRINQASDATREAEMRKDLVQSTKEVPSVKLDPELSPALEKVDQAGLGLGRQFLDDANEALRQTSVKGMMQKFEEFGVNLDENIAMDIFASRDRLTVRDVFQTLKIAGNSVVKLQLDEQVMPVMNSLKDNPAFAARKYFMDLRATAGFLSKSTDTPPPTAPAAAIVNPDNARIGQLAATTARDKTPGLLLRGPVSSVLSTGGDQAAVRKEISRLETEIKTIERQQQYLRQARRENTGPDYDVDLEQRIRQQDPILQKSLEEATYALRAKRAEFVPEPTPGAAPKPDNSKWMEKRLESWNAASEGFSLATEGGVKGKFSPRQMQLLEAVEEAYEAGVKAIEDMPTVSGGNQDKYLRQYIEGIVLNPELRIPKIANNKNAKLQKSRFTPYERATIETMVNSRLAAFGAERILDKSSFGFGTSSLEPPRKLQSREKSSMPKINTARDVDIEKAIKEGVEFRKAALDGSKPAGVKSGTQGVKFTAKEQKIIDEEIDDQLNQITYGIADTPPAPETNSLNTDAYKFFEADINDSLQRPQPPLTAEARDKVQEMLKADVIDEFTYGGFMRQTEMAELRRSMGDEQFDDAYARYRMAMDEELSMEEALEMAAGIGVAKQIKFPKEFVKIGKLEGKKFNNQKPTDMLGDDSMYTKGPKRVTGEQNISQLVTRPAAEATDGTYMNVFGRMVDKVLNRKSEGWKEDKAFQNLFEDISKDSSSSFWARNLRNNEEVTQTGRFMQDQSEGLNVKAKREFDARNAQNEAEINARNNRQASGADGSSLANTSELDAMTTQAGMEAGSLNPQSAELDNIMGGMGTRRISDNQRTTRGDDGLPENVNTPTPMDIILAGLTSSVNSGTIPTPEMAIHDATRFLFAINRMQNFNLNSKDIDDAVNELLGELKTAKVKISSSRRPGAKATQRFTEAQKLKADADRFLETKLAPKFHNAMVRYKKWSKSTYAEGTEVASATTYMDKLKALGGTVKNEIADFEINKRSARGYELRTTPEARAFHDAYMKWSEMKTELEEMTRAKNISKVDAGGTAAALVESQENRRLTDALKALPAKGTGNVESPIRLEAYTPVDKIARNREANKAKAIAEAEAVRMPPAPKTMGNAAAYNAAKKKYEEAQLFLKKNKADGEGYAPVDGAGYAPVDGEGFIGGLIDKVKGFMSNTHEVNNPASISSAREPREVKLKVINKEDKAPDANAGGEFKMPKMPKVPTKTAKPANTSDVLDGEWLGTNYDPYDKDQNRVDATADNIGQGAVKGVTIGPGMAAVSRIPNSDEAEIRLGTVLQDPNTGEVFLIADLMNRRFDGQKKIDFATPNTGKEINPKYNKTFSGFKVLRQGGGYEDTRNFVNSGEWDALRAQHGN